MQYQYAVPSVDVQLATAEETTRPVSRKYTEVITPPAVTPIPEETVETVETVEVEMPLKEEVEISDVITKPRTPSAMSFRGGSRVSKVSLFTMAQFFRFVSNRVLYCTLTCVLNNGPPPFHHPLLTQDLMIPI